MHGETDLVWRIFENGTEFLVKNFVVTVPVYGTSTFENGIQKWNVACQGTMTIRDGIATIS